MSGGTQIPLDFIILQKILYEKRYFFMKFIFMDLLRYRELSLKYRDLYTKAQKIIEENGYMYTLYFSGKYNKTLFMENFFFR